MSPEEAFTIYHSPLTIFLSNLYSIISNLNQDSRVDFFDYFFYI